MEDPSRLLINLILYGLLPLWGIAGFIDWCCHRATKVESTSGLKESLVHSLMGVQLGIPILLCLLFEINGRDGGITAEQLARFRATGALAIEGDQRAEFVEHSFRAAASSFRSEYAMASMMRKFGSAG